MTYTDAIKEGFRLINRNWQLVVMQFIMSVLGCVGFFVIVGVPLMAAFIMLGIDMAVLGELKELLNALKEPSDVLLRYSGIIIVILVSLLIYMAFAFSMWVFVLGATAGVIRNAIKRPAGSRAGFQAKEFFAEGKRLFLPLTVYMTVTGALFLAAAFLLGIIGGGAAALSSALGNTILLILFKVFLTLILMFFGLVLVLVFIAITAQGTLSVVFEGSGSINSLKRSYSYLKGHPDALGLYGIALGGYILMYFLLVLPSYPLRFIPIIGVIVSLPYQVFSYVVQSYVCLVALATLSIYYYATSAKLSDAPSKDSGPSDSTPDSGISGGAVQGQAPPPRK